MKAAFARRKSAALFLSIVLTGLLLNLLGLSWNLPDYIIISPATYDKFYSPHYRFETKDILAESYARLRSGELGFERVASFKNIFSFMSSYLTPLNQGVEIYQNTNAR